MERKEIINVLIDYLNDDRLIVYRNEGYPICVRCKDNEFSKRQVKKCCDIAAVFEMDFFICSEDEDLKIIFSE